MQGSRASTILPYCQRALAIEFEVLAVVKSLDPVASNVNACGVQSNGSGEPGQRPSEAVLYRAPLRG